MEVVSFPARQPGTHYRHELRTLTYVTLDDGNGGIVRNVNHEGVAVQAVAPLRQQQRVRLRFELRFPRLRVEAHGLVSWATSSGQCGIHFLDLPAHTRHQMDEWIFSNLLDAAARQATRPHSIFGASGVSIGGQEDNAESNDGLTVSALPKPPITLEPIARWQREAAIPRQHSNQGIEEDLAGPVGAAQLNWLSRPLSGRTLAWMVDGLVMFAGLLLFTLTFLSVAHELPQWPLTVCAVLAAAAFVVATYWTLFSVFGGVSLGVRLAQAASGVEEKQEASGPDRVRSGRAVSEN